MLVVLTFLAMVSQAQNRKTSGNSSTPLDERTERTRTFLGLGRAPDLKTAARGKALFERSCGFCHGVNARGATGPNLVRSPLVLHDEKGEAISPVVHNGRPDKGMPAFASFSNAELHDITEFLHLQIELVANRGTYKVQNTIKGDAKAGEAYFNGQGKCNSCHSAAGDLAHIARKFEPPDLQQIFLYPASGRSGRNVSSPPKVTVTLASGESISGTLKYQDDFDIILLDAEGGSHSFALGDGVKVQVEDKLSTHRQLLDQYTDDDMHNVTAYLATLK